MNSPDRPRQSTMTGRIRRVGGRPTFLGRAGVSSAPAPAPALSSTTAAPPLRLVPIITAPSRVRRRSCLDVGQVPPLDTGVEHGDGDHGDGAQVLEPGPEVDDPAAEDALGEADQDAADEGDPERLEAAEDGAGQSPDRDEQDEVGVERDPGADEDA